MSSTEGSELRGRVVGITAERRSDEFRAALERKGATVWHAPTIHIVPLPDDEQLRTATEEVLRLSIDLAVITTGQGFRGWFSAAGQWGLDDRLRAALGRARLVVRGPKAKGAVRGEGLTEEWSSPEETNADVLDYLLRHGVSGLRTAVQLHGAPLPEFVGALTSAGAEVIELQPYRWQRPRDVTAVAGMIDAAVAGGLDAIAFTSAPAAANLLTLAAEHGRYEELRTALRERVLCACVGPVTAAPLVAEGIPVSQPERQRLGALVKLIAAELPVVRSG
ncbi:uroporphyrinogen-III synthase [Haloechinothrix sp. LS1_15]|uniref:uroporphyrinogen-III synthase n=1 Tax=Haloechinothrix sp. LS1_15 TaxID=2652248 RepID=UPI002947982B|nr:uroporphyrinogen-III synthase [Haloechinothrix sp. LS1_15]MDV6013848.1 uroporphyrinogen-III synthase [Haloechinothrix sp. LS1_15]